MGGLRKYDGYFTVIYSSSCSLSLSSSRLSEDMLFFDEV